MLPNELLFVIFKNLHATKSVNSIRNVALSCKIFYNISKEIVYPKTLYQYTRTCFYCNNPNVKKSFFNKEYKICKECAFSRVITMTNAIKEFKIPREILSSSIPCQFAKSPYRKTQEIRLYDCDDVFDLAMDYHGGAEGLRASQNKSVQRQQKINDNEILRENRKTEIKDLLDREHNLRFFNMEYIREDELYKKYIQKHIPKPQSKKLELVKYLAGIISEAENLYRIKNEKRLDRKRNLVIALSEQNLALRSDSVLCSEYIEYGNGNIIDIVEIMKEMEWYFKNTTYAQDRYLGGYCDTDEGKIIALKKWFKENIEFEELPEYLKPPESILVQLRALRQAQIELTCDCGRLFSVKCETRRCRMCCEETTLTCNFHRMKKSKLKNKI